MSAVHRKRDFPVREVRRYLEPGPVVLVSSRHRDQTDIMTMGWHTCMEFTPSLIGCIISSANRSFELIRASRACVINVPSSAISTPSSASATPAAPRSTSSRASASRRTKRAR
jgi:flavin reductase (DIM6/NTAB) family NADH-FMN oxidoreductase RutF